MKNVKHVTLAALRNEDTVSFDNAIKDAIEKAALYVGKDVVILALCASSTQTKERLAA